MRSALSASLCILALSSAAQSKDSVVHSPHRGLAGDIAPYEAANGLPDLEFGPHVRGEREIRVWIGFGLGWPLTLDRLTERNGKVSGDLILAWNRDDPRDTPDSSDFAALMRYEYRGRCHSFRRTVEAETCIADFLTTPPWAKIWREIDTLGVWVLPDASTLKGGALVFDGWGMVVETWDGAHYRIWSYSNPESQPWPEAKSAVRIADAFAQRGPLKPSAEQRRYRGRVLTRADTLEFFPCEGGGPWVLGGRLDSLFAVTGRGDTLKPYRLLTPFYVELVATPDAQFMVRDWRHLSAYYSGVLEADSVAHPRPWAPEWCKRR
jgi:hypothetical protein